jgi:ATP-dependent Clp protease ATP-binding subunit ClpA
LFDEIEKAHPDVFQVLLQILDAGRMTDGHGQVVDFRNTVIIMTSNLGTGDERDSVLDRAGLEAAVARALQHTFRPEFRNRIDETLVFEPLNERHLHQIVELQLADVRAALAARGLTLVLTAAARAALVQEGYSPVFGARELRRTLQRRVIDPLANRLLAGAIPAGSRVVVGHRGGRITIRLAGPVGAVSPPPEEAASLVTEGTHTPPEKLTPPLAASATGQVRAEDIATYLI